MLMEAVVAPPGLHTSVVPGEAVAVSITEVVVQVNTLSAPALTVGSGLTVIVVVALILQPLASVTVTVYIPDAFIAAFKILVSCLAEINPFGPVHE